MHCLRFSLEQRRLLDDLHDAVRRELVPVKRQPERDNEESRLSGILHTVGPADFQQMLIQEQISTNLHWRVSENSVFARSGTGSVSNYFPVDCDPRNFLDPNLPSNKTNPETPCCHILVTSHSPATLSFIAVGVELHSLPGAGNNTRP